MGHCPRGGGRCGGSSVFGRPDRLLRRLRFGAGSRFCVRFRLRFMRLGIGLGGWIGAHLEVGLRFLVGAGLAGGLRFSAGAGLVEVGLRFGAWHCLRTGLRDRIQRFGRGFFWAGHNGSLTIDCAVSSRCASRERVSCGNEGRVARPRRALHGTAFHAERRFHAERGWCGSWEAHVGTASACAGAEKTRTNVGCPANPRAL